MENTSIVSPRPSHFSLPTQHLGANLSAAGTTISYGSVAQYLPTYSGTNEYPG